MRKGVFLFVLVAILITGFVIFAVTLSRTSSPSHKASAPSKAFSPNSSLFINAVASRTDDGRIVISGETNLPDGLKMWIAVEDGKLPLGAPREVAADNNVQVMNGQFSTTPFWMEVPNNSFTTKGWPAGVQVEFRERPFPAKPFNVHFTSIFNGAWQTSAVLDAVGGAGGKALKGQIIEPVNRDVVDSTKSVDYRRKIEFPPLSSGAKAISLVRGAVLSTPESGRSTGDVQAVVDMYMASPGLSRAKEWSAKEEGPNTYAVFFDFINGSEGEQQAQWQVDLKRGQVKYVNENGKLFSWAPSY